MAESILTDRACTINPSILQTTLNHLSESITKASSLAQVSLCTEFWSYNQQVRHDYLWALSDLIEHAHGLCVQLEDHALLSG